MAYCWNIFRGNLAALAASLGFLLMASEAGLVRAENLTTLDGKTYTNLISVSTNYESLVVIRHDGGKSGIKTTNLPEGFRAKYGIRLQSKPTEGPMPAQPTNSVDSFLAKNTNSDLSAIQSVLGSNSVSWAIHVKANGFSLSRLGASTHDKFEIMEFTFGEEPYVRQVLDKFLEWESIASDKMAEDFEKSLPDHPSRYTMGSPRFLTFSFQWSQLAKQAYLLAGAYYHKPRDLEYKASGAFIKDDILVFWELLNSCPALKDELAQKIRKRESQKDLFR